MCSSDLTQINARNFVNGMQLLITDSNDTRIKSRYMTVCLCRVSNGTVRLIKMIPAVIVSANGAAFSNAVLKKEPRIPPWYPIQRSSGKTDTLQ